MSVIICPNCKSILDPSEKMLKCANGHSFDFSKEGYINLLLPNQKKKLNPGDNKWMMNAREAFLSQGHYDFLIDAIEATFQATPQFSETINENTALLDLGCGTGYYTRRLFKDLKLNKTGIDISKVGVSKAAKKDKHSTYIVGSVYDLPIADNAVGLVLNVFSPVNLDEVKRVLQPGGYFIKVVPEQNHMKEIATLVYDTFIPHTSAIEAEMAANSNFQIIKAQPLEKQITLSGPPLHDLISMTPYLYKFEKGALEQLKELSVTISFKMIIAQYA